MTLNQIVALAKDTTFLGQCQAAALNYAHSVLAETPTLTNSVGQSKRYDFAAALISDGCVALSPRVAWGLASLPGFSAVANDTTNANDAALGSAIQTVWNDLALIAKTERT